MKWYELSTTVDNESVEAVSEIFGRVGHGGVSIEPGFKADADQEAYVVDPSQPVVIRTYLPADHEAPAKQRATAEALWHLGRIRPVAPLQVKEIDEEDWANAWKEHFHVHKVGKRTVIKPSWREHAPSPGEIVVELDPGMAFGTGLHPTTRLCLGELERWVKPGMRVLDLGTGSGILAIAAAKLGAGAVLARDVDPVAVHAAQQNVAMNGLANRVQVEEGSIPGDPRRLGALAQAFDLVVANIIAGVIRDLAASLAAALHPGGILIASGIIDERLEEVLQAFRASGVAPSEIPTEGDWRAVIAIAP